ncbi:MAG: YajQ family cyclic di-GMP-binding protein [Pseudomonadota bacterium]|nr:YajQ family cyclic di-GMP-binding protein [Pseudomonadota bacterium]
MPSFDVVSEFDSHEATNAVDQANREVSNRFDFKDTGSRFELENDVIALTSQSDFQLKQMMDILRQKLSKRGIDVGCLQEEEPEITGTEAKQKIIMQQCIDTPLAKELVKKIKASKIKVQASIQGEKLRVSGKKRDNLQSVIALLKDADAGLPLQYENFRD